MKDVLMRLQLSAILLGSLALAQQAHVNHQNFKPFGASLISPDVLPDKRVTFRVSAPKAQEVLLASGPLLLALGPAGAKPIPFIKGEDGVWTLTVGPVAPNIYVYKVTIDGATMPDPNNTIAGHGDQPPYSMLVVHGSGPAYYDARTTPHGTVTRHIYHSSVTNGERELFVYVPPGYSVKQKYPVLYLLGGSGELAGNWALEGRANFILDNLLAEGKAKPMLIVMPNNQMVHRGDPQWRELGADRVQPQRGGWPCRPRIGRALDGRRAHADRGIFAVLSAGSRETETQSTAFLNDSEVNPKVHYLLAGQGTWVPKGKGPTGAAVESGGAHDWGTWRHLLAGKLLPELWRK